MSNIEPHSWRISYWQPTGITIPVDTISGHGWDISAIGIGNLVSIVKIRIGYNSTWIGSSILSESGSSNWHWSWLNITIQGDGFAWWVGLIYLHFYILLWYSLSFKLFVADRASIKSMVLVKIMKLVEYKDRTSHFKVYLEGYLASCCWANCIVVYFYLYYIIAEDYHRYTNSQKNCGNNEEKYNSFGEWRDG